jgi:hypothetical protein
MPVRNSDIVQERLKHLHDTEMLSFRKIAAVDDYNGIPPGTLCAIYHGEPIPIRHREALGLPQLVKVEACPTCGVVHTRKTCPRRNGKRKRVLVDLPVDATPGQQAIIRSMSKQERLEKLLRD